jgi:hypothetical protein
VLLVAVRKCLAEQKALTCPASQKKKMTVAAAVAAAAVALTMEVTVKMKIIIMVGMVHNLCFDNFSCHGIAVVNSASE